MPVQSVESVKEKLLTKLRSAGPAGLAKGKLGIGAAKGRSAQAFNELIAERKIANLGTAARSCFVVTEHFNPLERACARIEENARAAVAARGKAIDLLIQKDLEKGCVGEVRKKAAEAIDWLVREGRLLRFRRSRTHYYIHAGTVSPSIAAADGDQPEMPSPGPAAAALPAALERQAVAAAYRRLRQRLGFSNVEIAELRREAGCAMEALKEFLLEESRAGRAVLSLGDASVSSEESRAAAIELFGRPHLLVRLDDE